MKRVKAACIYQTLHFMLKEDVGHDYAVKFVREEVAQYKAGMDKKRIKYKIVTVSLSAASCCHLTYKSPALWFTIN